MRTAVVTEKAPRNRGPFSQGVIGKGQFLYTSGQAPVDPVTNQPISGTFEEEATRALENLKAIVEKAGGTLDDVVRVGVYIRDMQDFPTFNEVYKRYFSEPFPARTTIQVSLRRFNIEVDAVVALSE